MSTQAYINFSKPHEEHWRIRDHGAWIADDRINIEGTSLHEPTLQKLEKKGQPLPADLTIWHRLFMKFTAITSKSPLFTMFIINVIIVTVSASVLQGYEEQYELDEQKVYDDTWAEFEAEFDMCLNTSAWLNGDMSVLHNVSIHHAAAVSSQTVPVLGVVPSPTQRHTVVAASASARFA